MHLKGVSCPLSLLPASIPPAVCLITHRTIDNLMKTVGKAFFPYECCPENKCVNKTHCHPMAKEGKINSCGKMCVNVLMTVLSGPELCCVGSICVLEL